MDIVFPVVNVALTSSLLISVIGRHAFSRTVKPKAVTDDVGTLKTQQASTWRKENMAKSPSRAAPSKPPHPYLTGNFAPIHKTHSLTPCSWNGQIPRSLASGQYVRNGANPLLNDDEERAVHWFDGDGMVTGVLFREVEAGEIRPEFVNAFIATDVYQASQHYSDLSRTRWWQWRARKPIPPNIATLIDPLSSIWTILLTFLRFALIQLLSKIPGSKARIERISVANTAFYYHDGRALATCESGPPIRVSLPELETVGWFDGAKVKAEHHQTQSKTFLQAGIPNEMTTGHPKVDLVTGEMVLFHSQFTAPFLKYSVIKSETQSQIVGKVVPGVDKARLMHDFGVSRAHTIIAGNPLAVRPSNIIKGKPLITYDPTEPCRFGVFPRHEPQRVIWYEDDACVISHTANAWDEDAAVCMIACRLGDPAMMYKAGNIDAPALPPRDSHWRRPRSHKIQEVTSQLPDLASTVDRACRLHFYRFPLNVHWDSPTPSHSFPLSAIDMEFPTTAPGKTFENAEFVYACASSAVHFGNSAGSLDDPQASSLMQTSGKIDIIAKVHTRSLVRLGIRRGCHIDMPADTRSVDEVLARDDPESLIQLFHLPQRTYAQEPRFVPSSTDAEDDGHLLFFTFDESQLDSAGRAPASAISELWILDARGMRDVVAKIQLVQRVPYGLHGEWFDKSMISGQRPWRRLEDAGAIEGHTITLV